MRILDTQTHTITVPDGATISRSHRVIPTEEFIDRIPVDAWDNIASSSNPRAVGFVVKLQNLDKIYLDSTYIQNIIGALESIGLINQAEADFILSDA